MALADTVAATPPAPGKHGLPCSVGEIERQLEGRDLEALHILLYGPSGTPGGRGRSANEVYDILRAEGFKVAQQTINRHRGGRCRCDRGNR